jgi:sterol 3beta-glucosyltransferase
MPERMTKEIGEPARLLRAEPKRRNVGTMHVVLATTGTLGDVQPFVALGLGLKRAGYDVTLATHPEYEGMARDRGLSFRRVGYSFKEQLESPAGRAWIESGDSLLRYKKTIADAFLPVAPRFIEDVQQSVLDADVLIFQPFALAAYHMAEKRGIPALCVSPFPFVVSGEIAPAFWPAAPAWPWLRRTLNGGFGKAMWSIFGPLYNEQRERLGLPLWRSANPIRELSERIPTIHVYSPSLLPRPGDWHAQAHVTGYCFLDAASGWSPPRDLVDFLEAGPPPIYVGFGSMTGRDPEELALLTIDAVTRAKQRAVLASGWAGIGRGAALPDHIFGLESVPHDWLFPRVSAVVHHGGAGTTHAGLRAGKPTFITAFFADQPAWGRVVGLTGAGPMPIHRRGLDAAKLAHGIVRTLSEPRYREGAERVAQLLAREDGVANAVAAVEQYVGRPPAAASRVA